jgi:hypothetical protein
MGTQARYFNGSFPVRSGLLLAAVIPECADARRNVTLDKSPGRGIKAAPRTIRMTGGGSGVLKLVPGLDPVSVDTYVPLLDCDVIAYCDVVVNWLCQCSFRHVMLSEQRGSSSPRSTDHRTCGEDEGLATISVLMAVIEFESGRWNKRVEARDSLHSQDYSQIDSLVHHLVFFIVM